MTNLTSTLQTRKAILLVIEDNADQWFMIRWALLQQFPEVEPVWIQEANQTIQYLEQCTQHGNGRNFPKLILLDLYIPSRQQGWQLLENLKTHHLYRDIPIVILSQSGDPTDISESYNLRGNSYIIKPISHDKWLDCIASFRHYWWGAVTLPK